MKVMKRSIFMLTVLTVTGVCSPAHAQFGGDDYEQQREARRQEAAAEWRTHARKIIANVDKIRLSVRPIWQADKPVGASSKYTLAWNYVVRKAREVDWACDNLIRRAQMIERGDITEHSIEELNRLIQKFNLACNGLTQAQVDLAGTPYDER